MFSNSQRILKAYQRLHVLLHAQNLLKMRKFQYPSWFW